VGTDNTDNTDTDDRNPAAANGTATPRPLLTLAQAANRLHLRPSALRRSMRQGTLLPDERITDASIADGQPRFSAATLDTYAAQRAAPGAVRRGEARSTLGPTLRRQLARVLDRPRQARVAPTEQRRGQFARWPSRRLRGERRRAPLWRHGAVRRWRERRMQRLYTLRELFRLGIRGQADLNDAIQHGDPLTRRVALLAAFWVKITNDWIFNLSGLLAYNFLFALFPILILVLAITGLVLGAVVPGTQNIVAHNIEHALPSGVGDVVVKSVTTRLKASAGWLLLVGLVTSLFAGSRLFITLENCFGVVFRLRGRDPIGQNRMAFSLLFLFLVLLPLLLATFLLPTGIERLLDPTARSPIGIFAVTMVGLIVAFLSATLLFTLIYALVPYRQRLWRAWGPNWRGAVVAAGLLLLYELLFPLYTTFILNPGNYGTIAAFAVVILVFFYYLAFILLLGAEINSWAAGQRETATDVPGILHAVQAHRSTRDAAGPTAGEPQEEMQRHR
jgi:membrane protein